MNVQDLATNAPHYIQIGLTVVGAASAIATLTPTPQDDVILLVLHKALNFLACNFGNAKNQ